MSDLQERQISGLTVQIDRSLCIGSGACARIVPDVLEFDDMQIVAFRQDAAEVNPDRLVEACSVCPVEALRALSASGEQLAP